MKKVFLLSFVLFTMGSIQTYSQTYKVLFLGNSYTGANNLPNIIASIADANGDTLDYTVNTPGGYTFEGHSGNQTTISYIASEDWDFVVLQEQSQRPSFHPVQVAQEVYPYAAQLDSMIKENSPCTETVFYMTWGRKYGDTQNCQFYPPICTYEGMQERLRTSYLEMANTHEATCAPVGMAWANSIQTDSTLNLYTSDNSHPNYSGSYLAACVFYATLYRESPVGNTFHGPLNATTAAYLQNIAAETVLDSMNTWRIGANDVVADFTHTPMNDTMFLDSISSNADTWEWIIDGNTVQTENAYYELAGQTTHEVTLIATSECGSDTIQRSIFYEPLGIEVNDSQSIGIYPNPNDGIFKINDMGGTSPVDVRISDVTGRLVYSKRIKPTETIIVGDLKRGTYLVTVEEARVKRFSRMVIH